MGNDVKNDEKRLVIWSAALLIGIGIFFIIQNIFGINILQLFQTVEFSQVWPILLVVFGILILYVYNEVK